MQSRPFIKEPDSGLSRQLIRLNRIDLKIVVGMFTGHCTLDYHFSHFHSRDRMCKRCFVYAQHARLRGITLGEYFPSIDSIIKVKVSDLLSFLRRCGHFPELNQV
ncbi:hypothetical protein EGO58_11855 [Limosilactobacillus reuteri]|nr:hypothetical protein EGO58_11855 [Limosilactobacillus reuteri]